MWWRAACLSDGGDVAGLRRAGFGGQSMRAGVRLCERRPCARSPLTIETIEDSSLSKRDVVLLNIENLFRWRALRGRSLTIPGRSRLRRLLSLCLFIELAVLLGLLRRFDTLAQEVNVAGIDFRAGARVAFTIGVLFETQPPLDVNLPALRQVFSGHLGLASPGSYAEPDCVLLHFTPAVLALFGRRDREVANSRSLRRVPQCG